MNKTLVLLLLLVHGSLSGKIQFSDVEAVAINEAQLFFDSIPADDRENFIVYYLEKGLREKWNKSSSLHLSEGPREISMFDELIEPENFSLNLLKWTMDEFELHDWDVAKLVSDRVVCLDNGKCVIPSDVGSNCCLF